MPAVISTAVRVERSRVFLLPAVADKQVAIAGVEEGRQRFSRRIDSF
mgnify:CR=1 FL=1